ncbi:MAG: prepilin-type N-terminal cleavage/methylation domain-containing protein [Alphaproteobacteria bacterium]|nr:prepilin-type N-terminal cleavage/methylation domain-containing protein [Alphaproteobacteria bacterium]
MMMTRRRQNYGFSLMELLLAVGIFAMLMLAIFELMQDFGKREQARATYKYTKTVADAMDQILADPEYFNALYDATVATGGGYQLVADSSAPAANNITKNFTVSGVMIQATRLLSGQFRPTSPIRSQIRILLKVADNPLINTDTRALEVVIVTATPRPDDVVQKAASYSGPHGGWIRTYGAKAAAVMRSAFSSWSITPSNGLQATNWYSADLRATLNSNTQGSYYLYYSYYNLADKTGDYLYRHEDLDTAGQLNTMYGTLNLGGNDIIGADNVTINGAAIACTTDDDIRPVGQGGTNELTGTLCVNGTGVVKGAAYVAQNMTVYGSATIADAMTAGNMRIQNALTTGTGNQRERYGAQALYVVDGTSGNQDTINVTNNAMFVDGTTAGTGAATTITGTTVNIPDGGTLTTGTITNTRRVTSTTVSTRNLVVDHQLKTGIVRGGNVTAPTSKMAVIDITSADNLVYGTAAIPKTVVAPKVTISNMSVDNFGSCDSGCGQ